MMTTKFFSEYEQKDNDNIINNSSPCDDILSS